MFAEDSSNSYSIVDDSVFYYSYNDLPVEPSVSFLFALTFNSSVNFHNRFVTLSTEGSYTYQFLFSGSVNVPLYLYKNNELLLNIPAGRSSVMFDVEFGSIYYVTDVMFQSSDFFAIRFPLYIRTMVQNLIFSTFTSLNGRQFSESESVCFLNPLPIPFFDFRLFSDSYYFYSPLQTINSQSSVHPLSTVYYCNPRISIDSFINDSSYDFIILNNSVPFYLSVDSDSDFLISYTLNYYSSSSPDFPTYSISYTVLTSHLKNIYLPLPDNSNDFYILLNFGSSYGKSGFYTELIIDNVQEVLDLRGFFRPLSTFYSHLLDPLVFVSSSANVSFIIAFVFSIISILILIFIIVFAIFRIRKGKG